MILSQCTVLCDEEASREFAAMLEAGDQDLFLLAV
jgi:succinate dehydrogenase flavin-adding protein (antitoxin of CptAB toxin-antitoxin module)